MTTSERRLLELALLGLESERSRFEEEVADIRRRLGEAPSSQRPKRGRIPTTVSGQKLSPIRRRKMTAAQRRKISQAMKARWAVIKGKRPA